MGQGLGAWLDGLAAARGAAPALVCDGEAVGFERLAADSRRLAGALARLGIGRGDRVAFWLPNGRPYLALFFACARVGAVAVAVNTRFRAHEVGDIVGRSGARALVLWPAFKGIAFLDLLAAVPRDALDRLETVILVAAADDPPAPALPPVGRARAVAFDALLAAPERAGDGQRDDGVAVFTTSGTTRAPKLVLHTQASVLDHAAAVAPAFGLDRPDASLLQMLPLCGVFGFAGALAALAGGAVQHVLPVFDAERAAACAAQGAIGFTYGTDEMIRRLLAAAAAPLPALRSAGFAAFGYPPAETVALGDARGVPLFGLYGMSEVQALLARQAADAPPAERAKPGGRLVAAASAVRVRDPGSGALLGPGADGELELTGPSLFREYLGDADATRAAFTADGWFRTGDLGRMEADGRFHFLTRMGDVMRLGGFLVAPAEVEDQLQRIPGVDTAQVVAVRTAAGERAVGFVVMRPGAAFDEAAALAHLRGAIAHFKVPQRVVALDALPTTAGPNGVKVQRARLREIAATLPDVR